ncbi:MAG: lysostaphin resistance A-like protein [Candidatus Limisoma sp.]
MNTNQRKFPIVRALASLTLFFVGGLLITALLTGLVLNRLDTIAALQLSIVAQNVLTFAMPAVVAAVIYTAKPWQFLAVDSRPRLVDIALMLGIYVASIPLVNYLVSLNEAIAMPECLSSLEQALKEAEENARAVTETMLSSHEMPGFAITLFAICVMTGIGEEFFFRGALQGILAQRIRSVHAAVWISALIFSMFHLQFYGIIPRTVIGAMLGYALVYSRCLWVPVIGHAINNAVAALLQAYQIDEKTLIPGTAADSIPILPLLSLAACVALIILWHRRASVCH